ncbi:APC family permease [Luteimonas chenhongjianii]|uniref:APC family permease n=2 Tax=Luteimonas TaxID=83614 RepID=UPI0018F50838|nr:amino acid permease [Luteimonas chenhongjianii]
MADTGPARATLRVRDAFAITVGVVIGAGIFRTPSLIAGASGSEFVMLAAWAIGGVLSIIGALCYAELATAYPQAGGDYDYLRRAYGLRPGFVFACARASVIQTGRSRCCASSSATAWRSSSASARPRQPCTRPRRSSC